MSSIRPLTELRSYWRDCGQGDWSLRFSRSTKQPVAVSVSNSQHNVLCRTIEGEIIPRLLLAHSDKGALSDDAFAYPSPITTEDVEQFVRLLLAQDIAEAKFFSAEVRARGVPLDLVFLEFFAPAARYLGELWKQDICDFADVTIALSRLQQLLREYSPDFENEVVPAVNARRAFLAVVPGDQHTFGLFVVREFFRRAGWHVCGGVYDTKDELLSVARSEPFDVVGLSIGCDAATGDLADLVRSLKRCASNPAAMVMVGGRFIIEHPELVTSIGADATASDGRGAVPSFPTCLT
jgi:MerR family transcriptional regulator, light-induced transcriptional regulator